MRKRKIDPPYLRQLAGVLDVTCDTKSRRCVREWQLRRELATLSAVLEIKENKEPVLIVF